MKLTAVELASVLAQGLFLTEKCDGCGKALNQTFRYTTAGRREVYCSSACRDSVFFNDRREARKHSTPGKCVYCKAPLKGSDVGRSIGTRSARNGPPEKERRNLPRNKKTTGTAAQSNQ